MILRISSISEIDAVAQSLLSFVGDIKIVIFSGEMGAGKTTLIKAFCACLGVKDVVSSPTYAIVNEYMIHQKPIYHFDFYRIRNIEEVFDMGYEEYFYSGNICLIEWSEKIFDLLPKQYVSVNILPINETEREFIFEKRI